MDHALIYCARHCSMCHQQINFAVLPNNSSPDIFSVSVDKDAD